MDEFADIWIEQCDAARDICDAWGALDVDVVRGAADAVLFARASFFSVE